MTKAHVLQADGQADYFGDSCSRYHRIVEANELGDLLTPSRNTNRLNDPLGDCKPAGAVVLECLEPLVLGYLGQKTKITHIHANDWRPSVREDSRGVENRAVTTE